MELIIFRRGNLFGAIYSYTVPALNRSFQLKNWQ